MIIPDINLLIYAYDPASPFHAKAAAWWQGILSGVEPVGLPHIVLFGFVRISTNRRILLHPLTSAEALGHVRSWLDQPPVRVLEAGAKHVEQVFELLETVGMAGNLVSDAAIAAIALDYEAVLHTADPDFMRFSGLRWFNPLTGMGSRSRNL